jgi:hypothetical protein
LMKTWHWIAIGGVLAIGVWLYIRARTASSGDPWMVGPKIGTAPGMGAGAPPLPNVAPSNPATGVQLAFASRQDMERRYGIAFGTKTGVLY